MFPTGFNPNMYAPGWASTMPAPGYGMPVPGFGLGAAAPAPYPAGAFPDFGALVGDAEMMGPAAERFVSSMSGGVVIDKDGAPAGRVPENSFVDLKDGGVYGPDGKKLDLPEGSTVDFFDLPDLAEMSRGFNATTAAGGGTDGTTLPAMKHPSYPTWATQIDGQWGPGGTTALNGGAKGAHAGCDHHGNSATKVGGAKGGGMTVAGGGTNAFNSVANLQSQLAQGLAQLNGMGINPGMVGGAYGGGHGMGPMGALGGYGKLGMRPGDMQQSLNELIFVLRDLVSAMKDASKGGGSTTTTQADTSTTTNSGPVTESGSSEGAGGGKTTTSTGAGTSTSTSDDSSSDTSSSDDTSTSTDTSTT